MDVALGCWNRVVSPGAMLNELQFSTARSETLRVSCGPMPTGVAVPLTTVRPCGFAQAVEPHSKPPMPATRLPESQIEPEEVEEEDFIGVVGLRTGHRFRSRAAGHPRGS